MFTFDSATMPRIRYSGDIVSPVAWHPAVCGRIIPGYRRRVLVPKLCITFSLDGYRIIPGCVAAGDRNPEADLVQSAVKSANSLSTEPDFQRICFNFSL